MPPKAPEKLTALDKRTLSRKKILAWFKAKRMEKLKALRKEIKSLSPSQRATLKKMVIENTKNELAVLKSKMPAKERQRRAKKFADEIFTLAMGTQPMESIVKKYGKKFEAFDKKVGKEQLYKYWIENNPKGELKEIKESPSYIAFRGLSGSPLWAKEAFLLLSLIEKHWSTDEAWRQYKQLWVGNKFRMDRLRKFFSKPNAGSRIGIYYGTRKVTWKPELAFTQKYMNARNWFAKKSKTYKYTGWFVVREDEANKNSYNTSHRSYTKFFNGIKGDKYLKSYFLYKCFDKAKGHLIRSGVPTPEQNKFKQNLDKFYKISRELNVNSTKKELLKWFKSQTKNKWIQPTQEIASKLAYTYGSGCNNYLYRYEPKQNKIYLAPIQGSKVSPKYYGGYITVKKTGLGTWNGMDKKNTEKLLKALINVKSSKELKGELTDYRLKRLPTEQIPEAEKLARTKGILSTLVGIPKYVEYNRLEKGYLDIVEKKLKAVLKTRGIGDARAGELAQLRARYLKKQIVDKIEGDEMLKKAVEDNEKVKIEIIVNSKDEVNVTLKSSKLFKKYRDARKKAEGAKTSAENIQKEAYNRLQERVEQKFGKAAPIVMWILDKIFKIRDTIKKAATGKGSTFGGVILGILGVKVSRGLIGSKKMNQEKFEKILTAKKKSYKLKRKMVFSTDVKLKGKKIVIPQGKGVQPGKAFKVKLKGVGVVTAQPFEKAKKGFSIGAIFSKYKRSKWRFKKKEIVIENGTTIPKDTVIPKGAKILKA